jgi:hypothetical protein
METWRSPREGLVDDDDGGKSNARGQHFHREKNRLVTVRSGIGRANHSLHMPLRVAQRTLRRNLKGIYVRILLFLRHEGKVTR